MSYTPFFPQEQTASRSSLGPGAVEQSFPHEVAPLRRSVMASEDIIRLILIPHNVNK